MGQADLSCQAKEEITEETRRIEESQVTLTVITALELSLRTRLSRNSPSEISLMPPQEDIGKASAYKVPTQVPKIMMKMWYCVSCAIHARIVAVRSVVDRRKRDTGKKKMMRKPMEQKKPEEKKEEVKA